ncbi:MAG: GNAT family N-acetyltransferase [Rhodoferax sp.]
MLCIRPSQDDDLPAITRIYAHHVLHGSGTFETEPPSQHDMAQRRTEVLGRDLPHLVVCDGPNVLGFAYCNWFKPRPAYRYSAEDSIYLVPELTGRGIGRLLLSELCMQAQRRGVRKLIAVIGDSANLASIGVHRACGFTRVGVIAGCGWKFNRWLDIVLMEKPLGAADQSPPQ